MANNIKSWARENDFALNGQIAAGTLSGWLISVEYEGSRGGNSIKCYISVQPHEGDTLFNLQTILKEKRKEYGSATALFRGGFLEFTLPISMQHKFKNLTPRLKLLLEDAGRVGFQASPGCSVCSRETSGAVLYRNRAVMMCDACARRTEEEDLETNKRTSGAGAVLLGILGALLGAIVGLLPYLLVTMFTDLMVGWLTLLAGACGAFGYRLFRGPKKPVFANVTIYLSVFIALVVMAVFTDLAYVYWSLVKESGLALGELLSRLPPGDLLQEYVAALFEFDLSVWENFGFTMLCGIIGMLGVHHALSDYVVPTAPVKLSVGSCATAAIEERV